MTGIIDPNILINSVSNIISQKKQVDAPFIDLTLKKLFRVKSGGELDFGGSEFKPGNLEPCIPVKRQPEDAYGWWELHEGYYLFEYNEQLTLSDDQLAWIQPHPHLLASGCFHPTLTITHIDENLKIPFWVPKIGVRIKQNARISRILIMEL